jgi:hypothetical protein
MVFRRLKNAKREKFRPAYLPLFAKMNPTAYTAWKSTEDRRPVRWSLFEPNRR